MVGSPALSGKAASACRMRHFGGGCCRAAASYADLLAVLSVAGSSTQSKQSQGSRCTRTRGMCFSTDQDESFDKKYSQANPSWHVLALFSIFKKT